MPSSRLEDVTCAICMESLFNLRDDLQEVLPIATPDCGHVHHEKCLLEWFRFQANQYVAQAREHGNPLPSAADAPAECPACRAECYADPETGEACIHRLYINFGDSTGFPSSSQVGPGSSPAPTQRWGRSADREVLGFARRSNGLAAEYEGMEGNVGEDELRGAIKRTEKLRDDAVSSDTAKAFKNHLGGLTRAINQLHDRIEDYPLVPTLQEEIEELRAANAVHIEAMLTIRTKTIPLQIQEARINEQEKADKRVKKVEKERDIMQRELEKERVARVVAKRGWSEREADLEKKLEEMRAELVKEKADRESTSDALADRTKQLKVFQIRADQRKEFKKEVQVLKAQNEELKAENARLLQRLAEDDDLPKGQTAAHLDEFCNDDLDTFLGEDDLDLDDGPVGYDDADMSVQSIPASEFQPRFWGRSNDAEESLFIEDSSFDASLGMGRTQDRPAVAARSTTKRTYAFDMDDGPVKRKDKERPGSRSKFFSDGPTKSSKLLQSDRSASSSRVLVAASSPTRSSPFKSPRRSPKKRRELVTSPKPTTKRTGVSTPFTSLGANTTATNGMPGGVRRPIRDADDGIDGIEVVNLISSSPEPDERRTAPLATTRRGNASVGRTGSAAEMLGLVDAKGRPKKGVALGAIARRRA